MIDKIISEDNASPVVVLFGGSPARREEVIQIVSKVGDITIYGALSEKEGIELLSKLSKVDLVLIGGAYTMEQRVRIKNYINAQLPGIPITEPGLEYPYNNENIARDIAIKLKM